MRRITVAILALGVAAGSAAVGELAYSASWPAPPTAPVAAAVPVVAEPVKRDDVPMYLRGIGTVQAYNTVTIRAQVQGQITDIAFKEGQAVRKGDLLVQIDPRTYQAQLDQAVANRDRDQALLANAQSNLTRDTQLLGKGWATPQAVDQDKANVGQYSGMVKADDAAIENAQVLLGYTRITSPIDGVTGIRQVDIGNIVHPADTNGIVVVTQLQPISVIFTLPQTDLPQIQQAMAKGALTVFAYSQDNKVELDKGSLRVLDNQIVQTSGSVRLRADFPNPSHRLWPGELVNARLLIETRSNALTVSAPAVQQGRQGPYVYVVKPDGTVEQRSIALARVGAVTAVVRSGLAADEQVVVAGQSRLTAGAQVTLLQGEAAQAALAATSAQQQTFP
jgi:multidrug efflux system membrane fusion protein